MTRDMEIFTPETGVTNRPRLLVVDDGPSDLEMLCRMFPDDYDVVPAASGALALELSRNSQPDLILLDVVMPGMDGFEVCRRLKDDTATVNIPILFVTAYDDAENEVRALHAGAVDFISKPFSPVIIRARVRTHLMVKRQTDCLRSAYEQILQKNRALSEVQHELSEKMAELEQYRDHLEELVRERTGQLEAARDAAEAASRAKSIFLGNISHEFRTPLTAVLGFAQLLELDTSLSAASYTMAARIVKSGERLLAMINDVLEMSAIETGRTVVHLSPFDLPALLEEMAVIFRQRAERKGLAFVLETSPELPWHIVSDPEKVRLVLFKLLDNGIKFTGTGSVRLRACPSGIDRIAIEIEDTGGGIAEEDVDRLFTPFEQLRNGLASHTYGIGLGLVISREYAHMLGGDITVTSTVGAGSRFRFELRAPVAACIAEPFAALGSAPLEPVATTACEYRQEAVPALARMSPEWRTAFREALARKSITRIRRLGMEAKDADPTLSAWILEHTYRYDLEELRRVIDMPEEE